MNSEDYKKYQMIERYMEAPFDAFCVEDGFETDTKQTLLYNLKIADTIKNLQLITMILVAIVAKTNMNLADVETFLRENNMNTYLIAYPLCEIEQQDKFVQKFPESVENDNRNSYVCYISTLEYLHVMSHINRYAGSVSENLNLLKGASLLMDKNMDTEAISEVIEKVNENVTIEEKLRSLYDNLLNNKKLKIKSDEDLFFNMTTRLYELYEMPMQKVCMKDIDDKFKLFGLFSGNKLMSDVGYIMHCTGLIGENEDKYKITKLVSLRESMPEIFELKSNDKKE